MQYALLQGTRRLPSPKLRAECPSCGAPMVAKCGTRIVWHWAHVGRRHCDAWWENETEWHRRWKSFFPEGQREVVHHDPATGEKHIADVKTAGGLVIELQNSPMPPDELRARESFYGRMIWIVNGAPFKDRLHILSPLPDPAEEWVRDLVIFKPKAGRGDMFWRKSDHPDRKPNDLVIVHGWREIEEQVAKSYVGHHLFDWMRPRTVWYEAKAPVLFDLGGSVLWRLGVYGDDGVRCVQAVAKGRLLSENGGTYVEDEPERIARPEPATPEAGMVEPPTDIEFDVPF